MVEIRGTKVYQAILQAMKDGKRGILLEGGTYSSKTYSALQALMLTCEEVPCPIDINVISETIPHLKGGCIRDWFKILGEIVDNNPSYNKSDRIYKKPSWNGTVTFLSADNEKALGMRREVLFINEADTLYWEIARELITRTEIFVILDWNPRAKFWAHEYYQGDPEWAYDHSTYLDALDVIPADKRGELEGLGIKDPNWWNVYGLGLMGKIEGLVYPRFEQVKVLPKGDYFYGLDYGYSADPTVLVKNVIIGENLYSEQMFYSMAPMTNDDIAREMTLLRVGDDPIYPDPNEPKSAEEIRQKGFNVRDSQKGPGSVKFGIKRVNSFFQHWTEGSLECIKEQRNYSYIRRREPNTGQVYLSDDTTHRWSHGMDARRYAIASHQGSVSYNTRAVSYL